MKDFPTWKVWKLVHYVPAEKAEDSPAPILQKKHRSLLNNVWAWIILSLLLNLINPTAFIRVYTTYSWLIFTAIHLLITLICLRFGTQVAALISNQHNAETAPHTEKPTTTLDTIRTLRQPIEGKLWGLRIATIVAFFTLCFGIPTILTRVDLFFFINWAIYYGFAHFIDYLQSFTAITLLVMLVNPSPQRTQMQASTIGYVLSLQITLYIVNALLVALCITILNLDSLAYRGSLFYTVPLTYIRPLTFIACSELINFVLWQAVKRRLEA